MFQNHCQDNNDIDYTIHYLLNYLKIYSWGYPIFSACWKKLFKHSIQLYTLSIIQDRVCVSRAY